MSRNVVGKDHVQPSKFSKCSQDDYHKALHSNPTLNCILKQQRNTRIRNVSRFFRAAFIVEILGSSL